MRNRATPNRKEVAPFARTGLPLVHALGDIALLAALRVFLARPHASKRQKPRKVNARQGVLARY